MKKAMLILLSCLLAITLAACGGGDSTDVTDGKAVGKVSDIKGTVRVALAGWKLENGIDALTGNPTIGLKEFLSQTFEKMYPNIKLELYEIPWENVKAKQSAMLLSKDVDVLYTGGAFASQWYQEGLLRELDDLIKGDSSFKKDIYLSGLFDSSYSTKSPDGTKQFGIPAVLGRRLTVFDTKLFQDWGVEPLTEKPTPQEIMEKAKKMTGKNPKTGEQNYGLYWSGNSLNGSTFVALTLAFGAKGAEGKLNDMKNVKWKLNTPEMVKVMEYLKEAAKLAPAGFVNAQGAENFGLAKNNIAIGLDQTGGATMSEWRSKKDKALLDRFEPRMNMGPKGEGWVAVDPFIMAKDAKDPKAAWEVLKFLSGYETQKFMYKNYSYTPTLKSPDFLDENDKFIKMALKVAEVGHSELMDEANPFYMSDIVPAVNGFISKAASGNAPDIQTFLNDLQARAEKWSASLK
ncbi:sugar ABC transporter substrate-binding protein [Paenibacillus sp. J31TS4]|uniref:ABC transporter substrate-binding protein n=1 Tax=Paenibacillus sp. J31TS4 TaxID=2807195 RepID=UPI001AFD7540|nr:extracellular solute-binding protein [Paenibacillus sp. J31TS4]GIP37171.1 sugar ABC transporter substrate-binding protein [Paenibacillus sp. J31TS4]